jgi:hypothetical protein
MTNVDLSREAFFVWLEAQPDDRLVYTDLPSDSCPVAVWLRDVWDPEARVSSNIVGVGDESFVLPWNPWPIENVCDTRYVLTREPLRLSTLRPLILKMVA